MLLRVYNNRFLRNRNIYVIIKRWETFNKVVFDKF